MLGALLGFAVALPAVAFALAILYWLLFDKDHWEELMSPREKRRRWIEEAADLMGRQGCARTPWVVAQAQALSMLAAASALHELTDPPFPARPRRAFDTDELEGE